MISFNFSIVVDDETYKVGDIVTISLYNTTNQYDYLYQDEDKTYEKVCTGRIAGLTTEEMTIDCSEKYQSCITTLKLKNINSIYKVKE